MVAVDELAKKIMIEVGRIANEEARRAADGEAARDSPRAIVAETEQQAQQILENAAGRVPDVIKAIRMTTDRVADELGSALTNIYNLLPASTGPVVGSNGKLRVGNGHVTVPASVSAIRERNQTMKRSVGYTEQGNERPASPLQTIEAERFPAVDESLEDAVKQVGKELVTSQTGEGAHVQEKGVGRPGSWELKKQGWSWRDIFWSDSRY